MLKPFGSREKIYIIVIVILTITLIRFNHTVNQLIGEIQKYDNLGFEKGTEANTDTEAIFGELCDKGKPNYLYEIVRRRLRHTVNQFTFLFKTEIDVISSEIKPKKSVGLDKLANLYRDFKNSLLNDLTTLKEEDGFDRWRLKEFKDLGDLVQAKIKKLQNPKDCSKAKQMVCVLKKQCGFGCQVHMIVSGLMSSYFTKRTLLLSSKGWHYNKGGWEEVLKPLSDTCKGPSSPISDYPGNGTRVVLYPQTGFVRGHRPYEPPMLPHNLVTRLNYIHDYPHLWWAGQFLKYVLRYTPETAKMVMEMAKESLKHRQVQIGLHVRRQDKIEEAPYQQLPTYMKIVEDYVNRTMSDHDPKKKVPIFLTTDEIKVVEEARKSFSNFEFLTDPNIAKLKPVNIYSESNFNQTIFNFHTSSHMKMLILTLSSNFGRLILEKSLSIYPDETVSYYSLDTDWGWPKGNAFHEQAYIRHETSLPGQLSFEVGDIIQIHELKRNTGYLRGLNYRTGRIGVFPAFKTKSKATFTQYPNYNEKN